MILLIISALLLSNPPWPDLLETITPLADSLQHSCLSMLPSQANSRDAMAALLCGQSLPPSQLKKQLIELSLIHLFVVSGSHLIWLEQILEKLKVPPPVRSSILGFYSLMTGWQAPAVRAWLQSLLRLFLRRSPAYFPTDLLTLLSGFCCLLLFPQWWGSLSLMMSWAASLALSLRFFNMQNWINRVLSNTLVWLLMLGPLWGFGNLHPLSCLYNLILGPLVGGLLIPLSLFACLLPPVGVPVFEFLLEKFLMFSSTLTEPVQIAQMKKIEISQLWLWVASWHLCFHFFRMMRARQQEALS
jgi:ComEC/Rec2-related protein